MPTTSSVSTPRGMMRSERLRACHLQRLQRVGLECFDVVVVNRGCLSEDFFVRHRSQQLCPGDASCPFLAEPRSILSKMRDELASEFNCCIDRQEVPVSLLHVGLPARRSAGRVKHSVSDSENCAVTGRKYGDHPNCGQV